MVNTYSKCVKTQICYLPDKQTLFMGYVSHKDVSGLMFVFMCDVIITIYLYLYVLFSEQSKPQSCLVFFNLM